MSQIALQFSIVVCFSFDCFAYNNFVVLYMQMYVQLFCFLLAGFALDVTDDDQYGDENQACE